jgi:cell division protein FtsB
VPPSRPSTPRRDARRRPAAPQPRLRVRRVAPATATEDPAQGPSRRGGFTGRAAILAVVVCALAVSLAYPLRQYVEQRAHIAELQQRTEETTRRVEELRAQKQRWEDPAYVEQQARERLFYVKPGETAYVIVGEPPTKTGTGPDVGNAEERPWYDRLWRSVDAAAKVEG